MTKSSGAVPEPPTACQEDADEYPRLGLHGQELLALIRRMTAYARAGTGSPQPARQRYVPAAPELGDAAEKYGKSKFFIDS